MVARDLAGESLTPLPIVAGAHVDREPVPPQRVAEIEIQILHAIAAVALPEDLSPKIGRRVLEGENAVARPLGDGDSLDRPVSESGLEIARSPEPCDERVQIGVHRVLGAIVQALARGAE